jgi:hypothetical protein
MNHQITHHGFLRPSPGFPWYHACSGYTPESTAEILGRQIAVIVAHQKRERRRYRPCVSGVVLKAGEVPAWGTIEGRVEE